MYDVHTKTKQFTLLHTSRIVFVFVVSCGKVIRYFHQKERSYCVLVHRAWERGNEIRMDEKHNENLQTVCNAER
jgi:hypothetical protein